MNTSTNIIRSICPYCMRETGKILQHILEQHGEYVSQEKAKQMAQIAIAEAKAKKLENDAHKCPTCSKTFKNLNQHITKMHTVSEITVETYKDEYNQDDANIIKCVLFGVDLTDKLDKDSGWEYPCTNIIQNDEVSHHLVFNTDTNMLVINEVSWTKDGDRKTRKNIYEKNLKVIVVKKCIDTVNGANV